MTDFIPFAPDSVYQSIPERFAAQVARRPHALAIVANGQSWTYEELNQRSNAIAGHLLDYRARANEPVVLLIEQGAPLVSAILGVLKAGKIYVPLDLRDSYQNLGDKVRDVGSDIVLARADSLSTARAVAPAGTRIFDIDLITADLRAADPLRSLSPESGAYIYYTSGTTGRAKGVLDTHRNVLHNIMRYTNTLGIAPSDRLTLLQGPSFSGAVSSLFGALLNGACSYPFDVPRLGVEGIAPWLVREGITIYHSVPSLFRRVAASRQRFPELRLIRVEGDAASLRDVELFRGRFAPGCRLVNGLGATECGLIRQFFVDSRTDIAGNVVPIGYPVADMDVVVLDPDGRELGPGEIGEIVVRSRFLAAGYWCQPELTATRFSEVPGAPDLRSYRTGDLGRFQSDGCLEHLGRAVGSASVRGQNVALADVEAALAALPEVAEAAVVTTDNADGETSLIAYVVGLAGHRRSVSRLRRELGARLAGPVMPSRFIYLDRVPRNANGKIDRDALPPITTERPPLDSDHVPPRNLLELQLVGVWERQLGLAPIGVLDDFFDLGGDSLLAVAMLAEVEELLGRRAPPSAFLETATIDHLASAMRSEASDLEHPVVPVQPRGTRTPFFFLHGDYLSGGFFCAAMARLLGEDQPFYALPPCGLDGGVVPPSYSMMAERHVAALRETAPRGPYRIGGLCNGGLVAFEMARLLESQGQCVDRLVLVAAVASTFELESLRKLLDRLGRWQRLSREARLERIVHVRDVVNSLRVVPWTKRLQWVVERASHHRRSTQPMPPGSQNPLRGVFRRIDVEYTPGGYGGEITLLWPQEDPIPWGTAAKWWSRWCHGVQAYVIPGSHTTCLTTHAASAAEVLRRVLVN